LLLSVFVAEFSVPGPTGVAQVVESTVQGKPSALGEVLPPSQALSPHTSQGGALYLCSEAMTLRNRMREICTSGSVGVPGG
jgi:hypothetical protein